MIRDVIDLSNQLFNQTESLIHSRKTTKHQKILFTLIKFKKGITKPIKNSTALSNRL